MHTYAQIEGGHRFETIYLKHVFALYDHLVRPPCTTLFIELSVTFYEAASDGVLLQRHFVRQCQCCGLGMYEGFAQPSYKAFCCGGTLYDRLYESCTAAWVLCTKVVRWVFLHNIQYTEIWTEVPRQGYIFEGSRDGLPVSKSGNVPTRPRLGMCI